MTKSPMGYDKLDPAGSDFVDIPSLWNGGVENTEKLFSGIKNDVDSLVAEALKSFDSLATAKGNKTTDTLTTDPVTHLDTWTSIVTDSAGHEVARKVDVEGVQADGKAMWTTTITIGAKVVTVTDKETANGWTREVR